MWECIALSKQPQKSLWGAVPLVKKIDAFSHSLGREQTLGSLNPALEGECPVSGRKQTLGRARLCLLGLSVRRAVRPVAVAITCKPFFTYRIKFAHLIFIENARQLLVCTAA